MCVCVCVCVCMCVYVCVCYEIQVLKYKSVLYNVHVSDVPHSVFERMGYVMCVCLPSHVSAILVSL